LREQGFRDIAVEDWSGVLAPAKTPAATIDRLSKRLLEMTARPNYAESIAKSASEPLSGGPAAYGAKLAEDSAKWAPVIKAVGFSMDS
jgi:tripartite-type tricarboxylate transporter receptor subunit TctC